MIREGSMFLTAGGGIVSNMPTQRQAEVAPTPMRSVPVPLAYAEGVEVNGAVLDFGSEAPEPWDYLPVPPVALDDDGYLIADSMSQNDRHLRRMLAYASVLKERYRGRGGMVGADLSMPYVKGSPGKMLVPDIFVALSAEEREGRSSYKLWEEPAPDFVLEDLSPGNWRRDAVDKRPLYQRLGVREYWMFDETAKRLRDDAGRRLGELLVGYWLRAGEYERVRANAAGRLPSKVLGLELCVRDGLVRFYDAATGEYLATYSEAQARIAALEAELRARRAAD